jgi:NADH-quinone oxidoreductase subunit G
MEVNNMVKLRINGKEYEVEPGKNLLHTCLALGFDIPYFCFHPALGSVGACRQCAVKKFKDDKDTKGRIVMSCMEPVADGLIISTDDQEVRDFRKSVIEALMLNHPHDCPVCDEGSECHLQDMTVMTGHIYRRYDFRKRTYVNQDLGPYINHEMNRCIQCYRCVRFYRDYAGGSDLHAFGSAGHVFFGRHKDGKLENQFSGNLVEVCPTGVFTDKTFSHHYTRKWDLTNSPSICHGCSVGCNTIISERYGMVRRIRSRYNKDVNGYFLCDRGRFGYEYINSPERIRNIRVKPGKYSEPDSDYKDTLKQALNVGRIAAVGSPTASLESNFALLSFAGKENFFHGIQGEQFQLVKEAVKILTNSPAKVPSLNDIEKSDCVLVLGEDPYVTAPEMALAIRQASRNESFRIAAESGIPLWNDTAVRDRTLGVKSPVFIASTVPTGIDDLAKEIFLLPPEDIAKLGFMTAYFGDKTSPSPEKSGKQITDAAERIGGALLSSNNPLIITGIKSNNINILHAAANIAAALTAAGKNASLAFIFPHCNSYGLGLLDGRSIDELLDGSGLIDTLIILENDHRNFSENDKWEELLKRTGKLIVLDHSINKNTESADVVLPSGTFAESTGTIVNYEGRAQRFYRVLPEDGIIRDSWKHISDMMILSGKDTIGWKKFDDVVNSMVKSYPLFAPIKEIMPDSKFRYFNEKVARQTPRYSGRTAMYANISVSEPKPPDDPDSPLNFSMEGYKGIPSSYLTPYYWAPGWNSPQAMNKYMNEPGGYPPDGNPGVLLNGKKNDIKTEYFRYIP